MHKGLKEPHLFNAAANPVKLLRNLTGILAAEELLKIQAEIDANVVGLYRLGDSHYQFALSIRPTEWRQRISRLYYAAYNVRRAVSLCHDGTFSSDSSDHQKMDSIPDAVANAATYRIKLKNLRDDRNLGDYNHLARETDLLSTAAEYELLVANFIADTAAYLGAKGLTV